jgi:hypothetical protein
MPVMAATGILPKIAGLDTSFGDIRGPVIHLLVSVGIGMTYALLFRNEAPSIGLGVPWGFLFGMIWWYVGPLTLLPLILTGVYDWRASAAATLLPSLIGHLIYRGGHCIYVSPTGAAISEMAASRCTHCSPRAASPSSGRNTGPSAVVLRARARGTCWPTLLG